MKPRADRDDALDITKGILVVLMVVYHSLNYSTQYFLAFRYMAFLPPTFIIITGFLLTRIYATRRVRNSGVNLRLFSRGGKLFLLFVAINLGAQSVRSVHDQGQSLGVRSFIVHWPDTFLVGSSRHAAFEILLPIAYLLLLAPALLWLDRLHRWILPVFTAVVIIFCNLMDRTGIPLPNLYFLSAGLIGMLLGRIAWASLEHLRRYIFVPILAYAIYAVVTHYIGQSFLLQLPGSVIALAAIYGSALWIAEARWPTPWFTRLGHYSLLAYIVQIAILQVLAQVFGRPEPFSTPFYALLVGTLILTALSAKITHWMRARLRAADYMYKAVFP